MTESLRFFGKRKQFRGTPNVLIDGVFADNMETHNKNEHHIAEILHVKKVNILSTRCTLADSKKHDIQQILQKLGVKFPSCGHKGKRVSGTECISSMVQHGNAKGYYVASGNIDLVGTLQGLPFVPIVACYGRGMVLKKPSTFQREAADEYDELGKNVTRGGRAGAGRGR